MSTSLKKLEHRLFHERSLVISCLRNQVKTNKGNNFTHRIQDFGKWDWFWPQVHAFWMANKRLNSWTQHIVKEERRAQMVQDIRGLLTYSKKRFEKTGAIAFQHDSKYCPFRSWFVCTFSTRIREEGKGVVLFTEKSPACNRRKAFPFPLISKGRFSSLMGPGSPIDIDLSSKNVLLSTELPGLLQEADQLCRLLAQSCHSHSLGHIWSHLPSYSFILLESRMVKEVLLCLDMTITAQFLDTVAEGSIYLLLMSSNAFKN